MRYLLLKKKKANLLLLYSFTFLLFSCNRREIPTASININDGKIDIKNGYNFNSLSFYGKKDFLKIDTTINIDNNHITLSKVNGIKLRDFNIIQIQLHEKDLGDKLSIYVKMDTLKSDVVFFKEIIE